jgi:hypothetical protein
MKILASLATVAVVLLVAAAPASAHRGSYELACGDQNPAPLGAPYTNLKAHNISCTGAHKVATKYTEKPFTRGYKGWTCDAKQTGYEQLKVKCARDNNGGQGLKFNWGA